MCGHGGAERGLPAPQTATPQAPCERAPGGAQGTSAPFSRERESIALLPRLNLKEVKVKLHKKYDYVTMPVPAVAGWGAALLVSLLSGGGGTAASSLSLIGMDFKSAIKASTCTQELVAWSCVHTDVMDVGALPSTRLLTPGPPGPPLGGKAIMIMAMMSIKAVVMERALATRQAASWAPGCRRVPRCPESSEKCIGQLLHGPAA